MNSTDNFTVTDYTLWSIALGCVLLYHACYFAEFVFATDRTNLGANLKTRSRLARKILSSDSNTILGIQGFRNSISSCIFFAGSTSTVSFILVQYTAQSIGWTYIQQVVLIGSLLFGFLNWLAVIKCLDHGTSLCLAEEFPTEPTEKQRQKKEMRIRAMTNLLQRGQLHYFFGIRSFFFSVLFASWPMLPAIAVLLVAVFLVIWMYFSDHQFSEQVYVPKSSDDFAQAETLLDTSQTQKKKGEDSGSVRKESLVHLDE